MKNILSGRLSVQDLLQHKGLEPLGEVAIAEVKRIQSLDVSDYSEADVREEIISPLLRVLGYDKQSYFSVDREKPIALLGRNKFLDYKLTLWSENFWLIEAKKPKAITKKVRTPYFSYKDLSQAVEYSVHPDINAALVVLCDGRKISVFDREVSQRDPLLVVDIPSLLNDLDKLRSILSPWQVWFFEKRRIIRHIDKVFDKEFNLGRIKEFGSLVEGRLASKRSKVVNNMRINLASTDGDDSAYIALDTNVHELVGGYFFLQHNSAMTKAIAEALVHQCRHECFEIVHEIFPDHPLGMNDNFCGHSLNFLIHLQEKRNRVSWLPAWLSDQNDLENGIQAYICLCLTHFSSLPTHKHILLCSSALRRLFKLAMIVDERVWRIGEMQHAITRYTAPEDNFAQYVSSPERQNLLRLDSLVINATAQLVKECSDDRGRPKPRLVEESLKYLWRTEVQALGQINDYPDLLAQKDLGEVHSTEGTDVTYDNLGHFALCILEGHPDWKQYALSHHKTEIEMLANIGSWQARKWLGYKDGDHLTRPTDEEFAERFFLNDKETYRRLCAAYGY